MKVVVTLFSSLGNGIMCLEEDQVVHWDILTKPLCHTGIQEDNEEPIINNQNEV